MEAVIDLATRFNLDFDDAYQCAAAARYELKIISFESDFDRILQGRLTPADLA